MAFKNIGSDFGKTFEGFKLMPPKHPKPLKVQLDFAKKISVSRNQKLFSVIATSTTAAITSATTPTTTVATAATNRRSAIQSSLIPVSGDIKLF